MEKLFTNRLEKISLIIYKVVKSIGKKASLYFIIWKVNLHNLKSGYM